MAAPADSAGRTPESADAVQSAVPEYGVPSNGEDADREGQPILSRLPSFPDVSAKWNRLRDRIPKPADLTKPFAPSDAAGSGRRSPFGRRDGGADSEPSPLPPLPTSRAESPPARGSSRSASSWPIPQPPPPGSAGTPGLTARTAGPAGPADMTAGAGRRARTSRRSPQGTGSGGQGAVDTRTNRQYGSGAGQPRVRNPNYQPRRRVGQEALGGGQASFDSTGAAVLPVPAGGFPRPTRQSTGMTGAVRSRPTTGRYSRRPHEATVVERRVVRRLDTWTVFKVSMLFYLCVGAIMLLAGVVLWNVAAGAGTLHNIEKFVRTILDLKTFTLHAGTILRWAAVAVGLFVLAGTFINVVAALIYNLISDVVGGIQVVELSEPD